MADILDVRFPGDEHHPKFEWGIVGLFIASTAIMGFAIYGVVNFLGKFL